MKNKLLSAVSTAMVAGTLFAGTAFADTATTTRVRHPFGGSSTSRPVVFGTVSAVNGSLITLTNQKFGKKAATSTTQTYTVNASAAVIIKTGATTTLASILAGDKILVQGTLLGTTVTATAIRDLGIGFAHHREIKKGGKENKFGKKIHAGWKHGKHARKNK